VNFLPPVRLLDVVDVLLVAVVIYRILSLIRGTRAVQVLLGLAVLLLAHAAARSAGLLAFQWVTGQFLGSLIVIVAVIFQGEIRRGLAKVGQAGLFGGKGKGGRDGLHQALARAAFSLARERTGAIVLLEREMGLNEIAESGRDVDARFSPELLQALFAPSSPLHDGAVLVRDGRIARAGLILPMASDPGGWRNYGTRHRAALGIATETDALALVVSEETGRVTLFHDREGTPAATEEELASLLSRLSGNGKGGGTP
jgi:uncharacterized protein (TIGR00159 family)